MKDIDPQNIPDELKDLNRWVCWRADKIPVMPDGGPASSTDPGTWSCFIECYKSYKAGRCKGVGFVLGPPYVGVDLDHCIKDGKFSDMAQDIINTLSSYTEVSPSGEGIHIIARGNVPRSYKATGLEIYPDGRYFTITGRVSKEYTTVEERGPELLKVFDKYADTTKGSTAPDVLSGPITAGQRNNTLTSIAGGLWDRGADYDLILSTLKGINKERCDPPLNDREIEQITRSISRYEAGEMPDITDNYEFNDLGNAYYMQDTHGHLVRYTPAGKPRSPGIWWTWTGTHWAMESWDKARALSRQALEHRAIGLRAKANKEDGAEVKRLLSYALKLGDETKINKTLSVMGTFNDIQTEPEVFDKDPYILNCQNGILDLLDGSIDPHHPGAYLSKISPIKYDPGAQCPVWDRFMLDITNGRDDLINYLYRCLGLSATANNSEHVFFMPVGPGRNGKTTFLETVKGVLGSYSVTIRVTSLMQNATKWQANPDLVRLRGARYCTTSETESNQRLAESVIKQITGGGTISARTLFGEPIEFEPYAKLWIDTNNPPSINTRDQAIWARCYFIPFEVSFKGHEDRKLKEKLRAEYPGILNRIIHGAQQWEAHGLDHPGCVTDTTNRIREEQDKIGQFIAEVCTPYEGQQEIGPKEDTLKEIYHEFTLWCKESGVQPFGKQEFSRELKARGYIVRKGNYNKTMIEGLKIYTPVDTMADPGYSYG